MVPHPLPGEIRSIAAKYLGIPQGPGEHSLVSHVFDLEAKAAEGDLHGLLDLLTVATAATAALGRAFSKRPEIAEEIGKAAMTWPVLRSPISTLDDALARGSGFAAIKDLHRALFEEGRPPRPGFDSDPAYLALEALCFLALARSEALHLPIEYGNTWHAARNLEPLSEASRIHWWVVAREFLLRAHKDELASVTFETTGSRERLREGDALVRIKTSFFTLAEVFEKTIR
jgi:hypothetical protein